LPQEISINVRFDLVLKAFIKLKFQNFELNIKQEWIYLVICNCSFLCFELRVLNFFFLWSSKRFFHIESKISRGFVTIWIVKIQQLVCLRKRKTLYLESLNEANSALLPPIWEIFWSHFGGRKLPSLRWSFLVSFIYSSQKGERIGESQKWRKGRIFLN